MLWSKLRMWAHDFTVTELSLVAIIIGILVAIVVAWRYDNQRPLIELKKDDWECVKSEQRQHLQPILVGKMTILQPMIYTVCVQYGRRAG